MTNWKSILGALVLLSGALDGCDIAEHSVGSISAMEGQACSKAGSIIKDPTSCGSCTCTSQQLWACERQGCESECTYEGKEYASGTSFPATDGCNTCSCVDASVTCTKKTCTLPTGSCTYAKVIYQDGDAFPSTDGCNKCTCSAGKVDCTTIDCGTQTSLTCTYTGVTYKDGDAFPSTDGC
ncbi:MAG: hypothetical protein ACM3ZE_30890, partial [Myxococcales bacterium]